jgi:hypothetical protein
MILLPIVLFIIVFFIQFTSILKKKQYVSVFLFSFLVKLIFLGLSEFEYLVLIDGGGDTEGFINESFNIYNSNTLYEILTKDLSGRFGTYPVFLSVIYSLIYPSHLVMLFINILLHNSIILLVIRIFEYLSLSRMKKYLLIILVAFFPIIISYSVILLREIIYIWYVTYICYQIFYYVHNKKMPNNILITFVISIFVFVLHPGNLIVPLAAFLLFFQLSRFIKIGLLGVFLIVLSFLFSTGQFTNGYINSYSSKGEGVILEKINLGRETSSAYYTKHYTSSVVKNIFYAFPIDFVNFYFRPFVLPISNIYARFPRYPAGILSLSLFLLIIKNFRYMTRFEKNFLWLLILGILPFVVGSGDLFQAVRHRMNFFTLIVILIALLLQDKKLNNQHNGR